MIWSQWCLLILSLHIACFWLQAYGGIAPGDESALCVDDPRFASSYPNNHRVLLDSYNYHNLLQHTISGSPWAVLNSDNSGNGWVQEESSVCRKSVRVCDFHSNEVQSNWLFTQYISYQHSREVYVNISFNLAECRIDPICNKLFLNVYFYSTNEQEFSERTDPINYEPIGQVRHPQIEQSANQVIQFNRPVNHKGFFLGIEDVGSCGNITRVQVFYKICPAKVVGLVSYPSLALPPINRQKPSEASGHCALNAVNTTTFQYKAYLNGTCQYEGECVCKDGYQENVLHVVRSSLDVSVCEACPAGTYKIKEDASCQICPQNTNTSVSGAAECPCVSGYFRTPSENSSTSCTAPPGNCRDLQVVTATDTAIRIRWTKPENTGREDYFYDVYYNIRNNKTGAFVLHNKCPFVNQDTIVEYTVNDLLPQTDYKLRVIVNNGVSNQAPQDRHLRACELTTSTTDGTLGVPRNVNSFCKVIIWEPPPESGSVVVGYDVMFGNDGEMEGSLIVSKAAAEVYHIVQDSDMVSLQQDVMIQVRAKSSHSLGPWSDEISLGCDTLCTEDQSVVEKSSQVTEVKVVNNVLLWSPLSSSDSALQYQVRYREIESKDDVVISVDQTLNAFVLPNLEQEESYTVQIRPVDGSVTGRWSDPYQFSSFNSNVFRSQGSLAIVGEPQNVSATIDSDINLSCSAISGSGPLVFVWGTTAAITILGLPKSVETTNDDGSVTSSILLTDVHQEHSGEYLCIVMDSRGSRIVSIPATVTVTEDIDDVMVMFGADLYTFPENVGLAHVDVVKLGNSSRPFSVRITLDRQTQFGENIVPSLEEFDRIVIFDSGTHVISVNISIRDDIVALEDTEILVFQLESSDAQVTDPAITRVQIQDDDRMSIGFTSPMISVEESSQEFDVCVSRSHISVVPLAVTIVVHPISATPPKEDVHVSSIPTSVVFDDTSQQNCFSVEVIDNDVYEETNSFRIVINGTNSSSDHIRIETRIVTIQIYDDDEASSDITLVLNGQVYFNNSIISLDEVEEGDNALLCMTTNPNCCDGSNRIGEFYYPNGELVPVRHRQNGFFRGRGRQFIRLNRLSGVTSPTGTFKCEILNGAGVLQNISFTLSRNVVTFSQKSYFFLESAGEVEVCVDKVDLSQAAASSVQVVVSGSLQEETGERIDQTLAFLSHESQKCVSFTLADDTIALEDTEMLTFSIDHISTNAYTIGDAKTTTVGIVDNDVHSLSIGSLQNTTEGRRMDLCVYFSTPFARQFDIILNSIPQDPSSLSNTATRGTDYTLAMSVSADPSASAIGRVCSPIVIVDDSIAEPVECSEIGINIPTENDQIVVSTDTGRVGFCIEDNDVIQVSFGRSRYMFLESNIYASLCVDKHGLTEETVQVMVSEDRGLSTNLVTFLPHEQTKCVDVLPLTDDNVSLEDIQTITFTFSSVVAAVNITVGDNGTTSIGILDDDELVVTLSKASNLTEGETGEICVNFSNPFARNFRMSISTATPINVTIPVLATPDIDYIALPLSIMTDENVNNTGRLCFPIEVLDDSFLEPVECLPIALSFPNDLMEVLQFEASNTIVCCITDNDIVVGFNQPSYITSEGRSQLELIVLVLEGHISGSHLVTFRSVDGTAIAGEDYNAPQTTQLQFDSRVTQVNVLITIVDDDVVEQMENFVAMLSTTDSNVQFHSGSTIITIEDNDARSYTISFEESEYEISESGGDVQVCLVVLEQFPISQPFSVMVTAVENVPVDALAGFDFLEATRTAMFDDKHQKACASFAILQDSLFESVEEHFTVVFSIDSSSLDLQKGMVQEATVHIIDDDQRNMYFQLNGVRIPYNNHTSIDINDIGEREAGLRCVTDNVNCCGLPNRAGEWYYPDGARISPSFSGMDFYRGRSSQVVQLNRRNNAQTPTGRFCCVVPDSNRVTQTLCINIVNAK